MAAETRASWTIDQGIAKRWESAGLENVFRAYWPEDERADYEALSDSSGNTDGARPSTPHPYCVYEKQQGVPEQNHTGSGPNDDRATTFQTIERVPVQFTVHAKNTATTDAKTLAKTLMTQVMAAFDPGTEALDIAPDCMIDVFRAGDTHQREGDEEWAWICLYEYLIDTAYNL